jgi:hypothetical protein
MAATPVPTGRTDTRGDRSRRGIGSMIAGGLAKAGSHEPYWQESGQNRERETDSNNGH